MKQHGGGFGFVNFHDFIAKFWSERVKPFQGLLGPGHVSIASYKEGRSPIRYSSLKNRTPKVKIWRVTPEGRKLARPQLLVLFLLNISLAYRELPRQTRRDQLTNKGGKLPHRIHGLDVHLKHCHCRKIWRSPEGLMGSLGRAGGLSKYGREDIVD